MSRRIPLLAGAGLLAAAVALPAPAVRADSPQALPAPALDLPAAAAPQTAVLAGGCFWGVQGVFEHVKGVQRVLAGYSGGMAAGADYETVSTGTSGHAESVQVTFDPQQITYGAILRIFFSVALDPTQRDYQGPDYGPQYRSEVFAADADQARVARAYIAQLVAAHAFARPIVTRVDPLTGFFPAEAYHQDYLERHPTQPYIVYNDIPKLQALRRLFPDRYRDKPVLSQPAT